MTISRADRAADQEAVARHLVEAVRRRFAARRPHCLGSWDVSPTRSSSSGCSTLESHPSTPRQPDLPDEPGVPIDILPPSELGVTVWVDAPEGATRIVFDVDVSFSMYLPEYPTWAEQRAA